MNKQSAPTAFEQHDTRYGYQQDDGGPQDHGLTRCRAAEQARDGVEIRQHQHAAEDGVDAHTHTLRRGRASRTQGCLGSNLDHRCGTCARRSARMCITTGFMAMPE